MLSDDVTAQDAQEGQGTAREGSGVALSPPPIPTGQNGHTNDARDNVVNLPQVALENLQRVNGPRVKRKEKWIDIEDESYEGFKFRVWVNYPQKIDAQLRDNDEDKVAEALSVIVLEHNGWLDEEGNLYPLTSDPQFWKVISTELVTTMVTLLRLESNRLPNSLIQKWRNTRNT